GQFKTAGDFYQRAESAAVEGGLLGSQMHGAILGALATCLLQQERYQEVRPPLERALDILRRSDEHGPDYGKALSTQSALLYRTGHFGVAELRARQALVLLLDNPADEPYTMATLNTLAVALDELGNPSEAAIQLNRAVEIGRKNPRLLRLNLAEALDNLASTEEVLGQLPSARQHDLEALQLAEAGFNETSSIRANILNNLGLIALAQKDPAKAELYCRRAAELWEKSLGTNSSQYAAALSSLAAIQRAQRQYRLAYQMDSVARSINESLFGVDHPSSARCLVNQGLDLFGMKKLDAALNALEQAERVQEQSIGRNALATVFTLRNTAVILDQLKRYGEASDTYARAIRALSVRAPGPFDTTLCRWIREQAEALRKGGRFGEAEMAEVQATRIEVQSALHPASDIAAATGGR
ncbi:MAG: tetratricopeptide repeat protein, partial [Bryobacteraceae bacterium]